MNGNRKKIVISESEKQKIKKMYGLFEKKDFVFDFVLTENNKYLIIMDEVFVAGGNGQTIGTIWENTHIFNELIKESISKLGDTITESVHAEVNNIIEKTEWSKELVSEWIKSGEVIYEGFWDSLKSGVKNVGDTIMKGAEMVFKNGVLPFLRWCRRNIYTGPGIVIDVVVSILAVKSNMIIWGIIILLDIYEIATGNYDPKDPERKESPFMYLIVDSLALVFTAGPALLFRKSIPIIAKVGIAKGAPTMVKILKTLSTKIPFLKNSLRNAAATLSKKFKGDTIVSIIVRAIDNILGKLEIFLGKLLSKQGVKAVATGAAVAGAVSLISPKDQTSEPQMASTDGETYQVNPDIMADAEELGLFN